MACSRCTFRDDVFDLFHLEKNPVPILVFTDEDGIILQCTSQETISHMSHLDPHMLLGFLAAPGIDGIESQLDELAKKSLRVHTRKLTRLGRVILADHSHIE